MTITGAAPMSRRDPAARNDWRNRREERPPLRSPSRAAGPPAGISPIRR